MGSYMCSRNVMSLTTAFHMALIKKLVELAQYTPHIRLKGLLSHILSEIRSQEPFLM